MHQVHPSTISGQRHEFLQQIKPEKTACRNALEGFQSAPPTEFGVALAKCGELNGSELLVHHLPRTWTLLKSWGSGEQTKLWPNIVVLLFARENKYTYNIYIYAGWWLSHPSEKYESVTWDDDIPNIWKNKK